VTALEQRDPAADLVAQIRSPQIAAQIEAALPEGVSIDRFQRAAATAIFTNPALLEADRRSLFTALTRCAHLGLMPDSRQAAIVAYKGKAQCLPMIGGYRDLLAEHGWTLRAHAVRKRDIFDYSDEPPEINHRKALADRGSIIGAYAVALHRSGRREQAVLTVEQIEQRRAKAQYKTVWDEWPDEQAEKTVGKYLASRIGLDDSERVRRLTVEADELEPGEARTMMYGPPHAAQQGSPPSSSLAATEALELSPSTDVPAGSPAGDVSDDGSGASPPPVELGEHDRALADAAGLMVPTSGKYAERGSDGPKTLAEILEVDPQYLAWAAREVKTPVVYVEALLAFTRVYLPADYEKAVAARGDGR
jgi:recombination protein RecT